MTRAAREDRRPSRRATRQVEKRKMSSQDAGEVDEGERRLKYKVQSNEKSELKLS